jgi:hypothetical protein
MSSVAELTRQMDDERRDLDRNLTELKTRTESALDWRDQVRKHPALVTAAALGAGMLLAQLGGRRRASAPAVNPPKEAAKRESGVLDAVGETIKATAATAVTGILAEFIPGFLGRRETQTR